MGACLREVLFFLKFLPFFLGHLPLLALSGALFITLAFSPLPFDAPRQDKEETRAATPGSNYNWQQLMFPIVTLFVNIDLRCHPIIWAQRRVSAFL